MVVREEVTVGANVGAVDEKEEATQSKLKEETYGEEKEAHLFMELTEKFKFTN